LDKWSSVLTSAGAQAVSQPPASLKAAVDDLFVQVKDASVFNLGALVDGGIP